ncbi:hypothetical protein ACJX0J_012576, partial [Zea mays]
SIHTIGDIAETLQPPVEVQAVDSAQTPHSTSEEVAPSDHPIAAEEDAPCKQPKTRSHMITNFLMPEKCDLNISMAILNLIKPTLLGFWILKNGKNNAFQHYYTIKILTFPGGGGCNNGD